jgi:hypothetical protein
MYEVGVLATIRGYENRIGTVGLFTKHVIEKYYELDNAYLATKQFDKDLEDLLK